MKVVNERVFYRRMFCRQMFSKILSTTGSLKSRQAFLFKSFACEVLEETDFIVALSLDLSSEREFNRVKPVGEHREAANGQESNRRIMNVGFKDC